MQIIDLGTWADRNGVNLRTARDWASKGHLEGAYQPNPHSPIKTGHLWLLPDDTKPPVLRKGNPNIATLAATRKTKKKRLQKNTHKVADASG